MPSGPIVGALDPIDDVQACLRPAGVPLPIGPLNFQGLEEALRHRVSQQLALRLIDWTIRKSLTSLRYAVLAY